MAGRVFRRRIVALCLVALGAIVACNGDLHAAGDGAWSGSFKGLAQEGAQVWVSGNRFKLFAEWPGGRIASADGEIRPDDTVRVCGTYQRSQQSDNLCIDGRFSGDRFTGRWTIGAGEEGEILLTRSGGAAPPASTAPAATATQPAPARATPAQPGPTTARRAAVVAVGDFIMPDGRPNESGRQQLLSHLARAGGPHLAVVATRPEAARADVVAGARYLGGEATQSTDPGRAAARAFGYNFGSPDRLQVTARVQVDLARTSDGLLLSEIVEAEDKVDAGANAQSAGAVLSNKAIGDAVQRLVARLTGDRQDFLAGIPDTPPAAPAAVAPGRIASPTQATADDRPVVAVGDFVMSDGARNETGRQLLIAALTRSAGDRVSVSGLSPASARHDFRLTGRNFGAEATVTGTRGGRASRVNVFKLVVQVQVEMMRVADGQVLTEQIELTDSVAGDTNAVNQRGANLLRNGIERAVAQISGRLTDDFLSVPRQAPVIAARPPPAAALENEFDRPMRRAIQEHLKTLGLYRGAIDGELGSGSRAAIHAFQRQIGETPTGILSNDQLARLRQQASARQAADLPGQQKTTSDEPKAEPARTSPPAPQDELAWEAIKSSNNPQAFAAFAETFPDSRYAKIAAALARPTVPPSVAATAGASPAPASEASGLSSRVDPFAAMRNEPRRALVIGNAAYKDAPLKNPVNDARAMAAMLARLGFEVIARENVTREQLGQAIVEFGSRLDATAAALFFYAGHGVQSRGRNYLIPVDATLNAEADLRYQAVDVTGLVEEIEVAKTRVGFVILDACRNNPFERRMRGAPRTRGLAAIDAARGLMIAYATAPGSVAADGDGENGTYTTALLNALGQPGLKAEEVFKRVRLEVATTTGNKQTPWESSSLTGDFIFNLGPGEIAAPAARTAPSTD